MKLMKIEFFFFVGEMDRKYRALLLTSWDANQRMYRQMRGDRLWLDLYIDFNMFTDIRGLCIKFVIFLGNKKIVSHYGNKDMVKIRYHQNGNWEYSGELRHTLTHWGIPANSSVTIEHDNINDHWKISMDGVNTITFADRYGNNMPISDGMCDEMCDAIFRELGVKATRSGNEN
jgi:hypothetical protein